MLYGKESVIDKTDKCNKQGKQGLLHRMQSYLYTVLMSDPQMIPIVYDNDQLPEINAGTFVFESRNPYHNQDIENQPQQYPNLFIDHTLEKRIQFSIIKAYERFPELHGRKIRFTPVHGFKVFPAKQHTMRSFGNFFGLAKEIIGLQPADAREYIIQINTLKKTGFVTIADITTPGGILMHELVHTLDYTYKPASQIVKFIIGTGFCPQRTQIMEKTTDETAIARGGGYDLYQYRQSVLGGSMDAYSSYKRATYLSPEEILHTILRYPLYYSPEILEKVRDHLEYNNF